MPTLYNYIVTATVPLTGSDLRYGTQDIRIGGSGTINGSSTAGMNGSTVPPNGTTNTTAVTWSVTAGSSSLQSWSQSGSNVNFVVKSDASPGDVTFKITSNGNTSQFFSITVHIIRPISAVTGGLVSSTDAALYNYTDPSGNSAKIVYLPRNTTINLKIAADPWNATNTVLLTSQNLLTGLSGETLSTFMTVGTKTVDASGVTTVPITIKDVDISGTKLISMAIFPQETYYSYAPYNVFFSLVNDSVSATTPISFVDGRLPYTTTGETQYDYSTIPVNSLVADASGSYKFVMKTGETNKQLFCGITPSTSAQGLSWSSSNTGVATVSSDGWISSVVGVGETVITATSLQDSTKKSTMRIVVFGDTVPNLAMATIIVRDASNIPLTLSRLPDGLYHIPDGTYAYMVQLDQIVTLSTSVIPNNADDTTYIWYTDVNSDFNGSYIAQDGTFTAYNDGASKLVRVVAQSNTNQNENEVPIYIYQSTPVSSMVSLNSTKYIDASGHTVVKPGDDIGIGGGVVNSDATFKNVDWTLSDSSLASLAASTTQSGNGVTFGSTEGFVTLTATSQDNPSISQSMTFRIWNYTSATNVTDISCVTIAPVLDASATDLAGQNIYVTHIPNSTYVQLEAGVLPEDALIKEVNWNGSSAFFTALGLAGADQVNGGNGFISIGSDGRIYADAQAYGYYAVTAQAQDGGAVSAPFYVYIDPYVEPISIEITAAGSATQVVVGSTLQLTRVFTPANTTDQTGVWSSDNFGFATVDLDGLVTGVGEGEVIISFSSYRNGSIVATYNLTVGAGSGGGGGGTVAVTNVSLASAGDATSVDVGSTLQLTSTVSPADATDQTVSYSSSDETVATVDTAGLVTGVEAGSVTITVTTTDGSITATKPLTVIKRVSGVALSTAGNAISMYTSDDPLQLTATVSPADASNKAVTYSSSDETVATVSANGAVTAIAPGAVTFTVTTTDGSYQDTYALTILQRVTSVGVSHARAGPYYEGQTLQMTANVEPANASDKSVTWSVSDSFIATVDASGLVTFIGTGVGLIITATANDDLSGNSAGSYTGFRVYGPYVDISSVTVTSADGITSINTGATLQLSAIVEPSIAPNKTVTWSSASNAIATVDASGVVTAVGPGTVSIRATSEADNTKYGSISITITVAATSVAVSGSTNAMTVGGSTQALTATVSPANATNKAVTWSSSDAAVASVDASGVVTAVANGSANIYATTVDGGHESSAYAITVTTPVSGITVTSAGGATSLNKAATLQLTATVAPADASNKAVTWSSSNTAVATVDASGLVTGVAGGSITITATSVADGTKAGTIALTVVVPVSGVTVASAGNANSLNIAATLQLTATVAPVDASNKAVTWSSSDTGVATVNASGLVTGMTAGPVIITATSVADGTKAGTIALTINPSTIAVTSVTVSGGVSVAAGSTLQLTATVAPADATNKAVTWSTSSSAVATVDASGLVTGVASGPVTIRATSQADATKFGSQLITVTAVPVVLSAITHDASSNVFTSAADGITDASAGIYIGDASNVSCIFLNSSVTGSNATLIWSTSRAGVSIVPVDGTNKVKAWFSTPITQNVTISVKPAADQTQVQTFVLKPMLRNTTISLGSSSMTITKGAATITTTATSPPVFDLSGILAVTATRKVIEWSTDVSGIIRVDVSGADSRHVSITGLAAGTVTITGCAADKPTVVASLKITVRLIGTVTEITRQDGSANTVTIYPGVPVVIYVDKSPASATILAPVWATSDRGVLGVAGLAADPANPSRIRATLTAPAAPLDRTAIITFTGQDSSKAVITKTAIFNVFIPVNSVSALTASQNPTYIGNTVQCACPAVLPTNATDKTLRWFVYDGNNVQLPVQGVATNKATINESTGLLGCSGEGYVTVFAVANDVPNIAALTIAQAGKKYNRMVIQILARAPGLTVYAEDSLGNTTSTVRFNTEPVQMKYILSSEPTQPYTITYKSLNTNNATVDASGVVCAKRNVKNTVIIEVVVVDSNGKMLSYTNSKGAKTSLSAKYTLNVSTAVTGISNNNTLYRSANIRDGPNCTAATGESTTLAETVKVGATAQYRAALLSDASEGVIPLPKNKGPAGVPTIQIVSWSAGTQPAIPIISATGNSPSVIVKRLRRLTTAETAANPNGIPVVLTATTYDGGYSTTITVYVK